jgi:hypothetical protein
MRTGLTILFLSLGMVSDAVAQETPPAVAIYPVLVQAPVYGAKVDIPSIPGGGGEGTTGTTDWGFNSAYMGGMELNSRHAFGEVDVLWTKPSASHDATPRIDVASEIWAITLKGGYRVYKGLGVTGGARYLSLDLDSTLDFPTSGVTLQGSSTRSRWLPFVGGDWRGLVARKWTLGLSADVGINRGDDSSTRLRARADWQAVPHLSIRLGYQMLHLALGADATLGGVTRHWNTTQTMHGPEFGLGIVF